MKKFREWMHGRGRNLVMFIVAVIAIGIVVHFFVVERGGHLGSGRPNPTVSPKTLEEQNIGGDSIGTADENATYIPGDAISPTATPTAMPEESTEPEAALPEKDTTTAKAQSYQEDGQEVPYQYGSVKDDAVIRLGFAGDICLDDTSAVMRHMRQKGSLSKVISPKLIRKMNAYDAMIINNEFSISKRGTPMAGKAYTFRSKPANVKYLKKLGVDVAGLANNHIFDYGKAAFYDTLKYLKKAGIATVGAGKNSAQAKEPAYLTVKGKKIAIVAATRAEKYVLTPQAGKNSPGVFRTYNDRQYVKAIKKAKKKADYVIVYVHWGTEYSTKLEQAQVQQAKDYINAGADAVVGAHTHCMQGIGYYKGVPIFYSLGNFWFNERTLYTTVLEINISDSGKLTAKLQPCLQSGKETKLLTKPSQVKKFVKYINGISTNGKLDKNCVVHKKK